MLQILSWRYWQDTFFRRRFFNALGGQLRDALPNAERARWRREMQRQARVIYAANAHRIVDEASRWHLAWVSRVLAAYHVVRPIVDNQEKTLALLRAANEAPFRATNPALLLLIRYGIPPLRPEQAFSALARNFKRRGERTFFGRGFTYEQDRLDGQRNFVNIRQCFFNDFFRANGAPELMRLFCPIDDLLLGELGKPKYRVRAERPTALGFGDDMCRFQFTQLGNGRPSRGG